MYRLVFCGIGRCSTILRASLFIAILTPGCRNQTNNVKQASPIQEVTVYIPPYSESEYLYRQSLTFRSRSVTSKEIDKIIESLEGKFFVLIEVINPNWGAYSTVLFYQSEDGGAVCTKSYLNNDRCAIELNHTAVTSALLDALNHALPSLSIHCNCMLNRGFGKAVSDASVTHLLWSSGNRYSEIWIMNNLLVHPNHLKFDGISDECMNILSDVRKLKKMAFAKYSN